MATPLAVLSPAARLPVELVEMICEELAVLGRKVSRGASSRWHRGTLQGPLAAAARISRKWAGPAQTALLRSLFFDDPDTCGDFLAAMDDYPHLAGAPRVLDFWILDDSVQDCEPHHDMVDFVPILFDKCQHVELVHIYTEIDISSADFDDAFRNMRHLRTFIFESNPSVTGPERNDWFQSTAQQLPASLRTLAVQYVVDLSYIFEAPASLDLLEYRYAGLVPHVLLDDIADLLDNDARPLRLSRFTFWVATDGDAEAKPLVSRDVVERFEAKFAARGVVFKLVERPWHAD